MTENKAPQRLSPKQARRYIIDLLKRYGLSAEKSLGQHYLINEDVLDQVVAACALGASTAVIEVGAGIGNLTTRLAESARRIVSLELDRKFAVLHEKMAAAYDSLSFEYGDAMKWPWKKPARDWLEEPDLVIAGNIPYQISSPLLNAILKSPLPWRRIVFLVQLEVGERLCAHPGEKIWGALPLKFALVSRPELIAVVPPTHFFPRPRVHSAILRIERLDSPALPMLEEQIQFFKMADGLFAHRRKQVFNSLHQAGALGLNLEQWKQALEDAGIDPVRRGESFTLSEAITLYRAAESIRNA